MDKIAEAAFSSHVKYGIKYGENSISIFHEFFAIIEKMLILGRGPSTSL